MNILVTGCAGFIGCHLSARFLSQGHAVIGLDNLSRPGTRHNLQWLRSCPGSFRFVDLDIRSADLLAGFFRDNRGLDCIVHEAAQVAVTTSVANPRLDFETNAAGTFNLLECARLYCPAAIFLFASTNKVYGGMTDVRIAEADRRYYYMDLTHGIGETRPLDFHSPYGCSKGTADQYVRDYHRIYGLRSVVFRQSCIYGTRQFGVEDQGWLAWFTIARLLQRPITIYGDGKQVRDVLWIDDLVDLYQRAIERIDIAAGKVYNVGGGPANSLSILDLLDILRSYSPIEKCAFADWRAGDQKIYTSDIRYVAADLGWCPGVAPAEGVRRLAEWAWNSRREIGEIFAQPPQTADRIG